MLGKYLMTRRNLVVLYSRGILSTFSSSSQPRRFNVLGVQQIALGSSNKQQLGEFWGTLMGLKMVRYHVCFMKKW